MVIDNGENNPYAPPKADPNVRAVGSARPSLVAADPAHVRAALARLKEHVASPGAIEGDLRTAGPRIRPVTWIVSALFVVTLIGAAVASTQDNGRGALIIGGLIAFFFGILALALLVVDWSFVPRNTPDTPEKALRRFLKGLSTGRQGYAWASLSPTARGQTVSPPDLGPIKTGEGMFSMSTPEEVKRYAAAFARPGQKLMRTMRVKSASTEVSSLSPDVAVVTAELAFQAWPIWINIFIGVGAAVFRPALLVAGILFFVMRKQHSVTVSKTMLQGQAGVWYVLDANLIEAPPVF